MTNFTRIEAARIEAARIEIRRWYTKPVETGCRSALQPASAGFCVSAAGFIPRAIIPRDIIPRARIKIRRWYTKPVKTGCRSARPPLQPASAGFCVSAAGFIPRDIRARLRIIPRDIIPRDIIPHDIIPRDIRARLRITPRNKNDQEAHYDVLA